MFQRTSIEKYEHIIKKPLKLADVMSNRTVVRIWVPKLSVCCSNLIQIIYLKDSNYFTDKFVDIMILQYGLWYGLGCGLEYGLGYELGHALWYGLGYGLGPKLWVRVWARVWASERVSLCDILSKIHS